MLSALLTWSPPASAEDGCNKVRFSDVGWTDITTTTAMTAEVLRELGYESRTDLLSLPVTFMSLKNDDIDVFLGDWMPTMTADIKPYLDSGDIVDLGVNLEGALYTFAVPRYVSDAGVTSAAHLARHNGDFRGRIYGVEPGNDGNRTVLELIAQDIYGLKGWTLVESSEQGMLGEVARAVATKEWIVFLGWKPHPMNNLFEMAYLTDPLEKWGPGGGASVVRTVVNKRFTQRCPNLVKLFKNMKFTVDMESGWMGAVLNDKKDPAVAAREWLRAHPEQGAIWKSGVIPANEAYPQRREASASGAPLPLDGQPTAPPFKKLPIGEWIESTSRAITTHFADQFRGISNAFTWLIESAVRLFIRIPVPIVLAAATLLAYALQRRLSIAAAVLGGGLLIWDLGYWRPTLETLALVLTSTALAVLVGVPTGVYAARRPRFYAGLRLVLDLMQTIPTFVYLIPTLMLFGLGIVPGLISTVIFVLPAPIRLTHLGITGVPTEIIEAGDAFGARPMQRLMKIEIPYALPVIIEGVTQALMLSLSMVVIAALVGAGGLGTPVVRALNTVNIGQGFEAGLVIVIVAVLLDRTLKHRARRVQH